MCSETSLNRLHSQNGRQNFEVTVSVHYLEVPNTILHTGEGEIFLKKKKKNVA